ncbi:MAG: M50 family metallopeptidase [Bacteroidales bacterium]
MKPIGVSLIVVVGFLLIKYFVPFGSLIMYPVSLFVTILHELGHAFFTVITGGSVHTINIHYDGSGYAEVQGGFTPLVVMGGYIGSAIFGNIYIHIGLLYPRIVKWLVYFTVAILLFTALYWYSSIVSSVIVLIYCTALYFVSKWNNTSLTVFTSSLGMLSVLYILEDYNNGPSSDLQKFSSLFGGTPVAFWMYIWLIIAVIITFFNIRYILKRTK